MIEIRILLKLSLRNFVIALFFFFFFLFFLILLLYSSNTNQIATPILHYLNLYSKKKNRNKYVYTHDFYPGIECMNKRINTLLIIMLACVMMFRIEFLSLTIWNAYLYRNGVVLLPTTTYNQQTIIIIWNGLILWKILKILFPFFIFIAHVIPCFPLSTALMLLYKILRNKLWSLRDSINWIVH